ncbi:hypothetical protein MF573_08440 [Klebsiella pneumoniae]|nr:hypothetical protein MF573_08440 [Klebsiella pneumoniae]
MGKVSARCIFFSSYRVLEGSEAVILLRTLQRELLLLVDLKRQSAHTPLRALFDKHRVWQNRREHDGRGKQLLKPAAVTLRRPCNS